MRVLIDSDAYIALYSKSDALHSKVTNLLIETKTQEDTFFTTWDVVDETTTKLSYGVSKKTSKLFLSHLLESDTEILYPDEDTFEKTQTLLYSIKSKRVSFTDCVNIITYKKYEIDSIFSFDKIYKKQGLNYFNKT